MFSFIGTAIGAPAPLRAIICAPERDLCGRCFGRLTVESGPWRLRGRRAWWCCCGCGTRKLVRQDSLLTGRTTSCGCAQRARIAAVGRANQTHGGSRTRLYSIWHGMIQRCEYSLHKAFDDYGGRGIRVCAEWRADFASFRAWAEGHGYAADFTLDRVNSDGHYEPSNCRWASYTEQNLNRRHFDPRAGKRSARKTEARL